MTTIQEKIVWLFIFGILTLVVNGIAKRCNFFTISYHENSLFTSLRDLVVTSCLYILINFLLLSIFMIAIPQVVNISTTTYSFIVFLFYVITAGSLILYYNKRPPQKNSPFTYYNNIISGIIACLIIYPTVLFVSQILDLFNFAILNITEPPRQFVIDYLKRTAQFPLSFTLTIITIIIIAPISEEILFRGYLQTWLKKIFGTKTAIVTASLIFALFHFTNGQGYGNITIVGSLFIVALYFGTLFERQKSLISPIIAHMIFNAISTINVLLSKEL